MATSTNTYIIRIYITIRMYTCSRTLGTLGEVRIPLKVEMEIKKRMDSDICNDESAKLLEVAMRRAQKILSSIMTSMVLVQLLFSSSN